jgi:hypothetical protein
MNSSCLLFITETAPYGKTDDKDGVLGYYYEIYIENKTDETIEVFSYDGIRLGSIQINKINKFNVEKRSSIYIIGKNSQKQYLYIICNMDQARIVVN